MKRFVQQKWVNVAFGVLMAAGIMGFALRSAAENQPAAGGSLLGQAAQAAQPAQSAAAQPAQSTAAQSAPSAEEAQPAFHPRLPMYYAKVVDEKQRQKIYDIQRKYHPQIAELQRQLEKLIAQRDAEIEGVLTPEQKAELDKIRAEAASRRKSNADDTTGSATGGN